ncbi:LacI family transcriptional regulator [Mycetocola sp. CAN_C7]|uniref:LacI family DNA-binding transcriptional regulator n=1 Tax=Mycetocola sp. CAN_C7 TaxID=2787724 RepID=UPI0018CBED6B
MDQPPRTSPVTLHDVAREAGVSLATASRALNGSERKVNEAYREKVLAAAARLNYTPNLSAQAVAKGATNTVALLVADIADPYFSSIAAGVIRASEQSGLVVTMAVTGRSPDRELELVRALRGQRPRVMILAGSRSSASDGEQALITELTAFEQNGGRVVFISQNELPFRTVVIDNTDGARMLATRLVELGYRRFAAITGADDLLTSRDRLAGFAAGLAEHDLSIRPDHIVRSEFTRDGGFSGAVQLIEQGLDDIDLVFAASDVMAVGALSAFREAGVVPGDAIAIAGFDDIPTVRDITPPLTTVRIPLEEIGAQALALAIGEDTDAAVTIGSTVVVRESTPPR